MLAVHPACARGQDGLQREIGRTTERELNVVLSATFGSVYIAKGEPEKILLADGPSRHREGRVTIDYNVRNRVGYLDMVLGKGGEEQGEKKTSFAVSDFKGGRWHLRYSPSIPISFDLELGVGKSEIDLSGLKVKDLNLSAGASDVFLTFNEPNESTIEAINIEVGVSKFEGRNLGNANFRRLSFQGGMGTYTLDFAGRLEREVDVDVQVGVGVVTIIVPEEFGARVIGRDSWVSRLDCDRDFEPVGDSEYVSQNFRTASGRMNIRVEAGLGSVRVRR